MPARDNKSANAIARLRFVFQFAGDRYRAVTRSNPATNDGVLEIIAGCPPSAVN